MELSYTDLLLQILAIMRYRDKKQFVKNFVEMNHVEAMTNCIEKLPKASQLALLAKQGDPEELKKHIPQDMYQEEITKVSSKALFAFLNHMESVLADDQKEQISKLISSV